MSQKYEELLLRLHKQRKKIPWSTVTFTIKVISSPSEPLIEVINVFITPFMCDRSMTCYCSSLIQSLDLRVDEEKGYIDEDKGYIDEERDPFVRKGIH